MNLYNVTFKPYSYSNEEVYRVVAATAVKAIEGMEIAYWKSSRRRPYSVTKVELSFWIHHVAR